MFKNYLKIALRNFVIHKLYTAINIIGLAIGIACSILILLFVRNELSYDRFHPNAENIYRVYVTEAPPGREPFTYSATPWPMATAMETSFPEVERAVRLAVRNDLVRLENTSFAERVHLVDTDFFEFFNFPLATGEPATVLQNLNAVVITESMAEKYFGDAPALGKRLSIKLGNEFYDFIVSGVAKDVPENSSIRFDFAIPFDNARKYVSERAATAWFNVFLETYVELSDPLAATDIESKLQAVVKNNYPAEDAGIVTLHLQPLTDIHLNPDIPPAFEPNSDPVYSYILTGIAVLVLGIACINFMTLAIGRSASRAREVGVRKVLGAVQQQLIKQFWGEAILMSFLALILGVFFALWGLPYFNDIAQKNLALSFDLTNMAMFFGLMLLAGMIAGSYPALLLSRIRPVVVMKGASQIGGGKFFGRSLVVLQFSLSIFLIISTLIMADQMYYLRTKNLGFNREQVVVIRNNSPRQESSLVSQRFRNAVTGNADILSVAGSSNTFSGFWTRMGFRDENDNFLQFFQQTIDYDYLETMEIELLQGRNFALEFGADSSESILINEAAAKYFNWQEPIGKSLPGRKFPPHRVIGVVKDFNFQSLQNEIGPLVMTLDPLTMLRGINDINSDTSPRLINYINIRIAPNDIPATMGFLKKSWQEASGNQPFNFSFLDEDVERQYRNEERMGEIVGYAAGFAILIACLGLFGLAALTVAKRTKEIGIRKVLGATVPNIVTMLSSDFAKLVLIANVVAWPLAFYVMDNWLQDFAYRIGIGWDKFILAAILAGMSALATVSYQAIRAALANPVEAIKYE
jgi:putative ABC transport system permease protein